MKHLKMISALIMAMLLITVQLPAQTKLRPPNISHVTPECENVTVFGVGYATTFATAPLGITAEVGLIGQTSKLSATGGFIVGLHKVSNASVTDQTPKPPSVERQLKLGLISTVMYRLHRVDFQYGIHLSGGFVFTEDAIGAFTGVMALFPLRSKYIYVHPSYDFVNQTPLLRAGVYL